MISLKACAVRHYIAQINANHSYYLVFFNETQVKNN